MKNVVTFVIALFFAGASVGQVIFWSEAFENGCSSGCSANGYNGGNGAWSLTTSNPSNACGPPDYPNVWYVSCAENGNAAGACGSTCGSDESLHLGSTSAGDAGAAYDAGGYCDLLGWPGSQTDTRANSPVINCTGRSSITLSFVYMEFGETTNDNGTLWYYNGTTWAQLSDPAKTTCCGGACNGSRQGRWTAYSIALPASANNNANVRLGFRWINNDDYSGTDPSFAIDDIQLSVAAAMPVSLLSFEGTCRDGEVSLQWVTASETNNRRFDIERSFDGVNFQTVGSVEGAGNSNERIRYEWKVEQPETESWLRLRQVDYDGAYSLSKVIYVNCLEDSPLLYTQAYFNTEMKTIVFNGIPAAVDIHALVVNPAGVIVDDFMFSSPDPVYGRPAGNIPSGLYVLVITTGKDRKTCKLIIY